MRKKLLTAAILLLAICTGASAQAVSTDSINILKQQKTDLKISKGLNDKKLKLAKLENSVGDKTHDLEQANAAAQQSANDNSDAASKLSADPNDKALARRADKSASEAKRDSRKARIAAKNLDDLRNDIANLKMKIAEDERKLPNATTQQ